MMRIDDPNFRIGNRAGEASGGGSGSKSIDGRVEYYADLPDATLNPDKIYVVEKPSGVIFINRRKAGLYYSDGITWEFMPNSVQADFVWYDNTVSLLTATDVQDAIDELATAGGTYTGTAERTVGGISDGMAFVAKSMTEMWDQLIKQEKFPTLTNPSSTFTASITGFREVGEVVDVNFNSGFSRGSISPQYTAASPFRSGEPNEYQYTGTGLVNQSKTDLSDAQTVSTYTVLINAQNWQGRVAYDGGVQPKSSYDNDFNSPLAAGNTSYATRTITGVYPYFGNTSDITVMTKQALASHGTAITIDLVAESATDKQSIEMPNVWGAVSKIEQWNPLSSSWDTIDSGTFTESATTNTIQGNVIDYRKYTHNGSQIGARRLRFTF
jgi:hypothetical protein